MHLRVTSSPEDLPVDFAFSEESIEATRFMDERGKSLMDLLRETSWELAQYQERCEELEARLAKHEWVKGFEPTPYTHPVVKW